MKYQVQEMLRVERIFEPAEIEAEIEAYNPLIPDGSNWKATFMIEYPDVEQRRLALEQLKDIEHRVWAQAGEGDRVFATANEDLDRSNEEKTAAVHFLRFELSAEQVDALRQAARLRFGIGHPAMASEAEVGGARFATRCLTTSASDRLGEHLRQFPEQRRSGGAAPPADANGPMRRIRTAERGCSAHQRRRAVMASSGISVTPTSAATI